MRQIAVIYYRKRDKHGVPRRIDDEWFEDGDTRNDYKTFIGLGLMLGKSMEELEAEWAEATKDGKSK